MAKQTLGEFLSTLRKASGYTQQDVSEILNVSNRTLSSWETDRTVPDLLILPSIADLYGVTVDELLRGERNKQDLPDGKITETALLARRKNKIGKFIANLQLYSLIAILGATVFVAFGGVYLFTEMSLWLNCLLCGIGLLCTIAFVALAFHQANSLLYADGIIFDTDLNDTNKTFVLLVKHKLTNILMQLSAPFLLGGTILVIVHGIVGSVGNDIAFVVYVVLNFVLGIASLVTALILGNKSVKKLGTEKQIDTNKANNKLARKTVCFGIVPIILLVALYILLCAFGTNVTTVVYEANSESGFAEYVQTYIVDADSTACKHYGIQTGEYLLQFPNIENLNFLEDNQEEVFYNLGNGFFGKIRFLKKVVADDQQISPFAFYLTESIFDLETGDVAVQKRIEYSMYWELYYNTAENSHEQELRFLENMQPCYMLINLNTGNIDKIFVNARQVFVGNKIDDMFWGTQNSRVYVSQSENGFAIYRTYTNNFNKGVAILAAVVVGLTMTICITIYLVKKKKPSYKI